MTSAGFEYKCRRCGEVSVNPYTSPRNAHQFLINEILDVSPKMAQLGMLNTHSCTDGGQGIGDLIGYRLEERE